MYFVNLAFYKFVTLTDLAPLREELREKCSALSLKGTILIAPEGINGFIAGPEAATKELQTFLATYDQFNDLTYKESISDHQPFTRMLVKIKKEIIAFGIDSVSPTKAPAPAIRAKDFKKLLDEKREVIILDTRNDYEVKLGTFEGAEHLNLKTFRQFPERAKQLQEDWKDKTIVTFCTGGIRCEKAAPLLIDYGFKNVVQLEGGILRYFEECGDAYYNGECFVFDHRVAVDSKLQETPTVLCFKCQMPVSAAEQKSAGYVPNVSCPACVNGKPVLHKEKIAVEIRNSQ